MEDLTEKKAKPASPALKRTYSTFQEEDPFEDQDTEELDSDDDGANNLEEEEECMDTEGDVVPIEDIADMLRRLIAIKAELANTPPDLSLLIQDVSELVTGHTEATSTHAPVATQAKNGSTSTQSTDQQP